MGCDQPFGARLRRGRDELKEEVQLEHFLLCDGEVLVAEADGFASLLISLLRFPQPMMTWGLRDSQVLRLLGIQKDELGRSPSTPVCLVCITRGSFAGHQDRFGEANARSGKQRNLTSFICSDLEPSGTPSGVPQGGLGVWAGSHLQFEYADGPSGGFWGRDLGLQVALLDTHTHC